MSDPLVGGVTVTLGSTSTDSMQFLDRHRERGRQLETFLRERLSRAPERNEKPRSHLAILLRLFTAESPWLVIFQRSSLASGVLEISIAAPLELLWVRGLHTVVDSGTITPDKTVRRVAALLGKEPQPVNMFYETVFPNVDEIFLFNIIVLLRERQTFEQATRAVLKRHYGKMVRKQITLSRSDADASGDPMFNLPRGHFQASMLVVEKDRG